MSKCKPTTLFLRKAVTAALDRIWQSPLTVIEAPMGYGKTTAVRAYLEKSAACVLWKTLETDSVSSFWQGFVRLWEKIDIDCARRLSQLGFPESPRFVEEAVRLMEMPALTVPTVIVIDDYHLLCSPEVDWLLESLIKTEIPNLHLVIMSRVIFGENANELALKGYCNLIGKQHFELTKPEIIEYYKNCGVQLKPKEADELLAYTEGWISALYLCLLNYLQQGKIEKPASLQQLLDKVVYQQCSDNAKELLLLLSIFDSFSLAQAEFLWPNGNAEKLLRELLRKNAFISFDPLNQTYQLHNILTSYLRSIFDKKSLPQKQAIWQAAGHWYSSAADYLRAMEFFHQAGAYDDFLVMLELDKGFSIDSGHKQRLISSFRECPPEVAAAHPRAALSYAINLFSYNEYELFAEQCEAISNNIGNNPDLTAAERNQLRGELEVLRSFTCYNRIPEMAAHHRLACKLLQKPSSFYDRNGSWSFEAPSVLYLFYRESGKLALAVQQLQTELPFYQQVCGGHGAGGDHVMLAEWHYHCGNFQQAAICAHTALYVAETNDQLANQLSALFIQLRLALQNGQTSNVTSIIDKMHAAMRQTGLHAYIRTIDLCEAYLFATLGIVKKIPAWIAGGNLKQSLLPFPAHGFFNIIYGRSLLAQSDEIKLLGLAGQFHQIAAIFPNLLAHIYTYIYEAIAHERLNQPREAELALTRALELAAPDSLMMPFVENGSDILNLLKLQTKNTAQQALVRSILKQYPAYAENMAQIQSSLAAGNSIDTMLTAREKEIAGLVAAGMSNQGIAAKLFVTEITVKKALQNIYAKLNINSRTALTKIIIEHQSR